MAGLDVVSILLVNFIIYFGQYVVIATTLNLYFGNTGIPNMSSNISVACGAYVVSSVVICMWIGGAAGLIFRSDWVDNNPYNVSMITGLNYNGIINEKKTTEESLRSIRTKDGDEG